MYVHMHASMCMQVLVCDGGRGGYVHACVRVEEGWLEVCLKHVIWEK